MLTSSFNFDNHFLENRLGLFAEFLPLNVIEGLHRTASQLYRKGDFHGARIGKGKTKVRQREVRSDFVRWIEAWDTVELEALNSSFLILQESLRQLFLPVKRFESHFACYPAGGHYDRHSDRHRRNPNRLMTAVLYLGEWEPGDGGELVVYHPQLGDVRVEPIRGRFILFDSTFEHQVLPAHKERWSLTTWFRDDIDAVLNL